MSLACKAGPTVLLMLSSVSLQVRTGFVLLTLYDHVTATGNGSSGSAFDARGDLILPNGQGASCSTGPPSDASFEFNTGNWTAGAYVIDVRLHVVGSSKPLVKAGEGGDCLLPPFTSTS
jgi:hypothetical protein